MDLASLAQFADFYNQVESWPKTKVEMDETADKILNLMNSTFVIVFFKGLEESAEVGVSVKFPEGSQKQSFNRPGFVKYLKEEMNRITEESHSSAGKFILKQVQHSAGNIVLSPDNAVQNLSCIGIKMDSRKSKGEFCGIILGSKFALTSEKEVALLVIFEHLIALAELMRLDIDLKIRSQFLSIASHELKTPLTSIYGILQLQERMLRLRPDHDAFPDQERHHHFLKMVIAQVERLNELIDGLLDISRIQNGRFMVEPTETDIASQLKESIHSRLAVIAQEVGVKLNVDAPPHLHAWVDPVRMEEVFNNLVMNAIRFSPEGGVVWVRLRSEQAAFRLTVRDQGPSISMEDRERIFQPFERVLRTARMGGLGLGLYISRQIAMLHGGNVTLVESIPGKGNVFEAYFPIQYQKLNTV